MTEERLKALLRQSIPPDDSQLERDLWPSMQSRLERRMRLSLFDWALVAAAIAWAVIFPNAALALIYHL